MMGGCNILFLDIDAKAVSVQWFDRREVEVCVNQYVHVMDEWVCFDVWPREFGVQSSEFRLKT